MDLAVTCMSDDGVLVCGALRIFVWKFEIKNPVVHKGRINLHLT